LTSTNETLKYL